MRTSIMQLLQELQFFIQTWKKLTSSVKKLAIWFSMQENTTID